MYADDEALKESKKRLDSVSPSFCMAKWMHTTIHLLNGRTHSCYLPPTHQIPLAEIQANPGALHNTSHKKQQRRMMLQGKRPPECSMCWAIEDLNKDHVSDRILRGSETWTKPYFDQVRQMPWHEDILPSYVEVSFSSLCNFKCSYCSPHVSTRWHEEIKEHGPYKLSYTYQDTKGLARDGLMPIEDESQNPYIDAFWKWWPELYKGLRVFRITGGEPLLSKNTFKILEWIDQTPNPNLELDINTNFGVSDAIFNRFFDRAKSILEAGKVRRFTIHTSLDTFGEQAEYIRHGLDFQLFDRNIRRYLREIPNGHVAIMCTFNALSVVGYRKFLDWVLELRREFNTQERQILLDIPHLTGPAHQAVRVLTPEYAGIIRELIAYMEEREAQWEPDPLFRKIEIIKLKRIHDWMVAPQKESDVNSARRDFYLFFSEHDRRRGTSFLSAFPEMAEFWKLCESLA